MIIVDHCALLEKLTQTLRAGGVPGKDRLWFSRLRFTQVRVGTLAYASGGTGVFADRGVLFLGELTLYTNDRRCMVLAWPAVGPPSKQMFTIVMRVKRVFLLRVGLMCAAVVLGGCASTAVFVAYPTQLDPIKRQIDSGQFDLAQTSLDRRRRSADKIIYLLERGRVAQINGDYATSISDYRSAISAIEANERKARISVSESLASGAAILLNDNAIPYAEKPYERVFLHHYQAINYLFSGDVEAAAVEVRRANEQQQLALDRHEDELAEIEDKYGAELATNRNFKNSFAELSAAAGRVKNSFQNAYTFYVSGVIWEIDGRPNDAYIDYKKALEIHPDNRYVQRDVVRLARALSMREDLERFESQFGIADTDHHTGDGEIVVFFDSGYSPEKQEIKIPLVVSHGVYAVAFPTYPNTGLYTAPLTVAAVDSRDLGTTSPIVNVQALAAKALTEQLPGMMVRQILRVAAKQEMTKKSSDAFGVFGAFATNVFTLITESADLRSWLTLPSEAQILRTWLAPGRYTLELRNRGFRDSVTVNVESQRRTILYVVNTGGIMQVSSIVL